MDQDVRHRQSAAPKMNGPDSSSATDAMDALKSDFEHVKNQSSGSDTSDTEDDDTTDTPSPSVPTFAVAIGDETEEEEEVAETPVIKNKKKDIRSRKGQGVARAFVSTHNSTAAANDEADAWMSKPVGGNDGEALPAAILPPPKTCPRGEEEESKDDVIIAVRVESEEGEGGGGGEGKEEEDEEEDEEHGEEGATSTEFSPSQVMQSSLAQYRERLFGDKRPDNSSDAEGNPPLIRPCRRVQLPNEVLYNASTDLWVATFHTDQKSLDRGDHDLATQSMRAFSFSTEDKAREAVLAKAPPRMQPFGDHPKCSECGGKFAVFRRACHCRNCGVCICKFDCSVLWPAKSLPKTFNIKGETTMNVCKSCHSLSSEFRDALLSGNLEEVIRLHETGNINLRSPFAHVKGEIMYPIHCAVLSGNLDLLRWLLGDRHCPFKACEKKKTIRRVTDGTIVTSKGRSLLEIAVATNQMDIMRYLVVEKNISVLKYKDLSTALVALDSALRRIVPNQRQSDVVTDMVHYNGGREEESKDTAAGGDNAAIFLDENIEVSIEDETKADQAKSSEGEMEEDIAVQYNGGREEESEDTTDGGDNAVIDQTLRFQASLEEVEAHQDMKRSEGSLAVDIAVD